MMNKRNGRIAFWAVVHFACFLAVSHVDAHDAANDMICRNEPGSCAWQSDTDRFEVDQQPLVAETPTTATLTDADPGASGSNISSDEAGRPSEEANPPPSSSTPAAVPDTDTAATVPATAGPSGESPEPLPAVTTLTLPTSDPPAAAETADGDADVAAETPGAGSAAGAGAAAAAAEAAAIAEGVPNVTASESVSQEGTPAPAASQPSSDAPASTPDGDPASTRPPAGEPLAAYPPSPGGTPNTIAVTDADAAASQSSGATVLASAVTAEVATADVAVAEAAAVEADSPLEELRSLLQQARLAVGRLEAEVTRQERRLAALPPAATPAGALAADSAVAAAAAAALRSLGVDGSSTTSVAARKALREALQLVLRERAAVPAAVVPMAAGGGAGVGLGAGGGRTAAIHTSAGGAGVGEDDWFGRHFGVHSATRLPPPPAPADMDAAATAELGATAAVAPAAVTCAFPYELPHPDAAAAGGGSLQYIVAGDAAGMLYILSAADGAVMAALPTGTDSPVTACSAYYVRRYESTLVTGHANGQTRSFAVVLLDAEEAAEAAAAAGEGEGEPPAAAPPAPEHHRHRSRTRQQRRRERRAAAPSKLVVHSVRLRHVVDSMPQGALPWPAVEELPISLGGTTAGPEAGAAGAAATGASGELEYEGPPAPIMHILPYRLGQKATGRRHVLVLDRAGNLRLERDNGTLRFWSQTNRTQMAVRFVGTHVVMLSAYHATLINTLQPRPPRAHPCHQLNGSRLLAASFDGHRTFRGYGINGRGELLSLVTPHEGGLTTCKAHRATPLPWLDPELLSSAAGRHSLSLMALRGYLLLTHGSHRVVFNVTGVVRTGIPALTSVADDMIADVASAAAVTSTSTTTTSLWGTEPAPTTSSSSLMIGGMLPPPPVVAVGPGTQVIVLALLPPPVTPDGGGGSGGGGGGWPLVVVLDSRMPRPAVSGGASKIWSQPVFVAAMLMVGLYQFWRISNARTQRRTMPSASRGMRGRRGSHGAGYGSNSPGDAADYMYGEGRMPLQPRSALRRGRSDRPMGRSVTYEDDDY